MKSMSNKIEGSSNILNGLARDGVTSVSRTHVGSGFVRTTLTISTCSFEKNGEDSSASRIIDELYAIVEKLNGYYQKPEQTGPTPPPTPSFGGIERQDVEDLVGIFEDLYNAFTRKQGKATPRKVD